MIEPVYKVEKVILNAIWKHPEWRDVMQWEGRAAALADHIFKELKKEAKKDDSMYLDIY